MNKKVITIIIISLLCIILCIVIFMPAGKSKPAEGDSIQSQIAADTDSIAVDTDSVSHNPRDLGYPKSHATDDWQSQEDKADNDDDYDPYDDPDWDETTPGESRPEHFIRGNIPDPELYPEDVVKEWVDEHGTDDEKRDVEEGNY